MVIFSFTESNRGPDLDSISLERGLLFQWVIRMSLRPVSLYDQRPISGSSDTFVLVLKPTLEYGRTRSPAGM